MFARFRSTLLLMGLFVLPLLTFSPSSAAQTNANAMNTSSILRKLSDALGGLRNIAKIHTLYFEWNDVSVQSNTAYAVNERSHGITREWLTSVGDNRVESRTTDLQSGPLLEVLTRGQQSVVLPVSDTNSMHYIPMSPARICSTTSTSPPPLCVNTSALFFDKVSPIVPPHAIFQAQEKSFTGTISESDTCSKVATVKPNSGKGPQTNFAVTPSHVGTCKITLASDSPQGWMLLGDQGWPSGNSSGAMQGPDLEREISHVYWMTFGYLGSGGLPGSVSYTPTPGASTYLVDMNPDGGEPIKAFINAKTFLPEKIQIGDDPHKMVLTFDAWESVDHVHFPNKMTADIFDSSLVIKYTLQKAVVNISLPKDFFKQPTPAL